MKIEYSCLPSIGKGFITNRKPKVVEKRLTISFLNAPKCSIAIFENEAGNTLYRDLEDKSCLIPLDFLVGEIKVVIASKETQKRENIICESFYSEQKTDGVLVSPNWLDIPKQVIDLHMEFEKLVHIVNKQKEKIYSLEKRIEEYEVNGIELLPENE